MKETIMFINLAIPILDTGTAAQIITHSDFVDFGSRHNVINLSNLKARGLSFKVGKTIGSEPQLRRTGYGSLYTDFHRALSVTFPVDLPS